MQFERRRNGAVYVAEAYADNQQELQPLYERWPTGYVQWEMLGIPWREPDGTLSGTGPAYVFWRPKPQPLPTSEATGRSVSAASAPPPPHTNRNQQRGDRSPQSSDRAGSGRWNQKTSQSQGRQARNSGGRGDAPADRGRDRRPQSGGQPRRSSDRTQNDRANYERPDRRSQASEVRPAFNTVQPANGESAEQRASWAKTSESRSTGKPIGQGSAPAQARHVPKRRGDRDKRRFTSEHEAQEPQLREAVEAAAEAEVRAPGEAAAEAEVQAAIASDAAEISAKTRTNRGPRTTKHKNITRLDRADKDMYGYLVRLMWRGETRQKFFSDRAYVDSQEALEAAIAWRDEMERELGKPRSEGLVVGRASSNTGIVGVTRTTKRGDPVFQVTWYEGGRQRRRVFNIRLLGESRALRAAIKARSAAEEQRLVATASDIVAEE